MMLARARDRPAGHSTETIEQISAYGFAGTLPASDSDAGLQVRARFDDVVGAIGRWLAQHFSRLRGNDYRSRLIAAGMYTTTPERLLGMQFLSAVALPFVWLRSRALGGLPTWFVLLGTSARSSSAGCSR